VASRRRNWSGSSTSGSPIGAREVRVGRSSSSCTSGTSTTTTPPPAPYDRIFDPDYDGDLDASNFENNPALRRDMPARDLQHLVALYDGEIRFTDEWIGRLLGTLDRMGIGDDTIVVVTADHGDEFFEHGRKGHAVTLYDEVLRVPLVIRYGRRVAPGQVVDEQVRLEDVAPTILGLADVTPPEDFGVHGGPAGSAGVDLSPWLLGRAVGPPPTLPVHALLLFLGQRDAIRTKTHKLLATIKGTRRNAVFFDLLTDPGEKHPRLDLDDVGHALDDELTRWRTYWTRHDPGLSQHFEIDAKHEAQLRELGYVQ